MSAVRNARVVYDVFSSRVLPLSAAELTAAETRHPIDVGHLEIRSIDVSSNPGMREMLMPDPKNFVPELLFDDFARMRRSRWVYRIEAREAEPEDLGYLRSAMLAAGEVGVLSEGLIVDSLAWKCMTAGDIAEQIDRPFDPLNHLSVHIERSNTPYWVHTHGMEKFAHPDFELKGVPRTSLVVARRLLGHLAAAVVAGGSFQPGEETKLCGFAFDFRETSRGEPGHFSMDSLTLGDFRLLSQSGSPEMEGMLACVGE